MSMDRCYDCQQIFDTDDDPKCWVEIGNMRRLNKCVPICEACRWVREQDDVRMEGAVHE